MLAGQLLMLAVGCRCAAKRRREIGDRREGRVALDPTRQTVGDFLQHPAIAVRIAERRERVVGATLRIRAADPDASEQVGLVGAGMDVVAAVEDLADLDAALSSSLRAASMSDTIRYRPWEEPGFAGVTFLPKITEAPEPGGVN